MARADGVVGTVLIVVAFATCTAWYFGASDTCVRIGLLCLWAYVVLVNHPAYTKVKRRMHG
jgi:hypothetical protein